MSENKDPVDPEVLKKLGRVMEGIPPERPSHTTRQTGGGSGIIKPYDPPKEYSFDINLKNK